jgi:hypothetical protein
VITGGRKYGADGERSNCRDSQLRTAAFQVAWGVAGTKLPNVLADSGFNVMFTGATIGDGVTGAPAHK